MPKQAHTLPGLFYGVNGADQPKALFWTIDRIIIRQKLFDILFEGKNMLPPRFGVFLAPSETLLSNSHFLEFLCEGHMFMQSIELRELLEGQPKTYRFKEALDLVDNQIIRDQIEKQIIILKSILGNFANVYMVHKPTHNDYGLEQMDKNLPEFSKCIEPLKEIYRLFQSYDTSLNIALIIPTLDEITQYWDKPLFDENHLIHIRNRLKSIERII